MEVPGCQVDKPHENEGLYKMQNTWIFNTFDFTLL